MINAIGQHDERFPPFLLLHQLVGGKENRIVKSSSNGPTALASTSATPSAAVTAARSAIPAPTGTFRHAQLLERVLELLARGGQVPQQFHFMIEVDNQCLTFTLP